MSDLSSQGIQDYINKYGSEVLIETGSWEGAAIAYALKHPAIKVVYSCEISPKYHSMCVQRFAGDSRVSLYLGDSRNFLRETLPNIKQKSIFWLDAHHAFHFDKTIHEFTPDDHFPLMAELKLIKELKPNYEQDVIICDDMIAIQNSPRWHPGEISEYAQVSHFTFDQLRAELNKTHTSYYQEGGEGLLTFFPRY